MSKQQSKGEQVLAFFEKAGADGATRKAAAEAVGCTVQRVGEVVRAHGGFVQDGRTWRLGGRTERCEHEKKSKRKMGTCKKCPEVAR